MSLHSLVRVAAPAIAIALFVAAAGSAEGQSATAAARPDTVRMSLTDTLRRFHDVLGTSRDRSALIDAAVDALHGRMSFPPPLVLESLHRDGRTVLIDMVADSLPTVRWRDGGGTVRILADGRRVIVRRHN